MSHHCSKNSKQTHLLLKTILRKLGNRYQTFCTAYKIHAIATCHRCAGHLIDRDTDLHMRDVEATGQDTDNESTNGSDTTIALGGPEVEGQPNEFIPSNQAKLTALMREINNLCLSRGRRRPSSRNFGLHRTGATLQLQPSSTPDASWTLWGSNMPVHRHLMYHTKANQLIPYYRTSLSLISMILQNWKIG